MRKRFIAGATCPQCQQQDTLALWRENDVDVVACVTCGHQMREADKQAQKQVRPQETVIGIFRPK
ncbi:YheV family putative zinc ribbon protein [Pantoea sp. 1.19]|uniref:YheV family putative zinc ribbon protein n=1 Tax=Pantoea sp. 1.19 TaxID=1925589 RepID=UPI000948B5E4|nr:YheV family putative zinc ribbon protein [Pantoea sp. 1.19]